MSYKYVPSGVLLVCDKGAGMGTLTATHDAGVTTQHEPIATDADLLPQRNISSCGACSVLQGPYMPVPVQWQQVKLDTVVSVTEWHPLLDCSTLTCGVEGTVRILFIRAEASAALDAQTLHEAANVAKEASLWSFVAGVACAALGVACCLTGVVAAPFLFAASEVLFETSAVTFEASIALDVAALAVEPHLPSLGLVVVDALTLGAGKLIGKVVGKGLNGLAATEWDERTVAEVVPYTGFSGNIKTFEGRTTTVLGRFEDHVTPGTGTKVVLTMPDGSFTRGGQNPGALISSAFPRPNTIN